MFIATEFPEEMSSCYGTALFDLFRFSRFMSHTNQYRSPVNAKTMLVKRVIALPGDRVRTSYGKGPYVSVPEGRCWIEGDNSRNSNDSNNFGAVRVL